MGRLLLVHSQPIKLMRTAKQAPTHESFRSAKASLIATPFTLLLGKVGTAPEHSAGQRWTCKNRSFLEKSPCAVRCQYPKHATLLHRTFTLESSLSRSTKKCSIFSLHFSMFLHYRFRRSSQNFQSCTCEIAHLGGHTCRIYQV